MINSVDSARKKPTIAARPFRVSENSVKPCGILVSFSSSELMRTMLARRTGAAVAATGRPANDEVLAGTAAEVGTATAVDTKAMLAYGV